MAKIPRGIGFSESEDTRLTEAWLEASSDPLKGADQQGDAFWATASSLFNRFVNQIEYIKNSGALMFSLLFVYSSTAMRTRMASVIAIPVRLNVDGPQCEGEYRNSAVALTKSEVSNVAVGVTK